MAKLKQGAWYKHRTMNLYARICAPDVRGGIKSWGFLNGSFYNDREKMSSYGHMDDIYSWDECGSGTIESTIGQLAKVEAERRGYGAGSVIRLVNSGEERQFKMDGAMKYNPEKHSLKWVSKGSKSPVILSSLGRWAQFANTSEKKVVTPTSMVKESFTQSINHQQGEEDKHQPGTFGWLRDNKPMIFRACLSYNPNLNLAASTKASKAGGGFDWGKTPEGSEYWFDIIVKGNYYNFNKPIPQSSTNSAVEPPTYRAPSPSIDVHAIRREERERAILMVREERERGNKALAAERQNTQRQFDRGISLGIEAQEMEYAMAKEDKIGAVMPVDRIYVRKKRKNA